MCGQRHGLNTAQAGNNFETTLIDHLLAIRTAMSEKYKRMKLQKTNSVCSINAENKLFLI